MGSGFSQQLCCALCERCRRREEDAANAETSETKPILPTPAATATFLDTQPPTPALKVPRQGSKGLQVLVQERRASADALEENGESCSAADPAGRAEGWEAAWNPMDLCVAPADEEVEGEDLNQAENQREEEKNTEEEVKSVPAVPEAPAVGAPALGAEQEQPHGPGQPGREGAGITVQEGNLPTLLEILSGAEPGQGCDMEPPAAPGEGPPGRELSPCAVQVAAEPEPCLGAGEGTGRAGPAGMSPQRALRAELSWLVEAVSLLAVQNPSGVTARGAPEPCPAPAVPWESLWPQWGSPEPPRQQRDLLKPGLQGGVCPAQAMGSLCCAEPLAPPELLRLGAGALGELGQEGSRGWAEESQPRTLQPWFPQPWMPQPRTPQTGIPQLRIPQPWTPQPRTPQPGIPQPRIPQPGTPQPRTPQPRVPQPRIPQPTPRLPEEPRAPVPVPAKQEAEIPNMAPSLLEGLGSSGEVEAENAEA